MTTLSSHRLNRLHQTLKQEIATERSKPMPNDVRLKQLKVQKLSLKDQLLKDQRSNSATA